MSQNKTLTPRIKVAISLTIALILLLGIYLTGNTILPAAIKSSFENKNCQQVLSLDATYTSAYPAFITDKSSQALTKECALYTVGMQNEQNKAWQLAYKAYQDYKKSYPNGQFANEADERSAQVLIIWVKDQLTAKQYTNAIENINIISQNFGYTSAASQTNSLMSDIYITWAKDQKESNNFTGAETTLIAFNTWASHAKKPKIVNIAKLELAKTYLAWGKATQDQKNFEDAKTKLELAISTDPEPLTKTGPAMQAKTAKIQLYIQWADLLLTQNNLAEAINNYQIAISLADLKDQPDIKDHIATAHLKSASNLSNKADFLGALKEVEQARQVAMSENEKKSIEATQADIYNTFSKSSGEQAQQAIKDAIEKVCTEQKIELPIFGTDTNNIFAELYIGHDAPNNGNLIDKIKATTPRSLHYVACVTETQLKQTVRNSRRLNSNYNDYSAYKLFGHARYTVERVTLLWDITVYDLKTGKKITAKQFSGSAPLGWGEAYAFMNTNLDDFGSFIGLPPTNEDISLWLQQFLK